MSLEELLQTTAATLGIRGFKYNRHESCEFVLGSQQSLFVEPAPLEDALHVYAEVGALPPAGREAVFETLLKAQLFHREVGEGCCFGLNDETGRILLNVKMSLQGLGEEKFLARLNEFANWASHWRDKLEADSSVPAPGDAMPHFLRA
jgi:hypothetical protein